MTHTLVTILGKVRSRDGDAGYSGAAYCFPGRSTDRSVGLNLALDLALDIGASQAIYERGICAWGGWPPQA